MCLFILQQIANLCEEFLLGGTLWLFGSSGLFLLVVQLVDTLQHQEDTECDNQEVDDVLTQPPDQCLSAT